MKIEPELLQMLIDRAYGLAVTVHYEDVPEEGAEQPLLDLLRHIRELGMEPTWYDTYDDPQLLLGPLAEERKSPKVDSLSVDHRGRQVKRRAERPHTVTRGLPYVISPHLPRLRRLQREWEKSRRWHSSASRQMLDGQCESLYYRVYGQRCYYGPLPSGPDYRFLLK